MESLHGKGTLWRACTKNSHEVIFFDSDILVMFSITNLPR